MSKKASRRRGVDEYGTDWIELAFFACLLATLLAALLAWLTLIWFGWAVILAVLAGILFGTALIPSEDCD